MVPFVIEITKYGRTAIASIMFIIDFTNVFLFGEARNRIISSSKNQQLSTKRVTLISSLFRSDMVSKHAVNIASVIAVNEMIANIFAAVDVCGFSSKSHTIS